MPPSLELMGPSDQALMQAAGAEEEAQHLAPSGGGGSSLRGRREVGELSVEESTDVKETIPLAELPPLPSRHAEYWMEPLCGISFVLGCCAFFVTLVQGVAKTAKDKDSWWLWVASHLIYLEVAVAVFCLLFLLFGQASMIKRSKETCYPIPAEVEERLQLDVIDLSGLANVPGPAGSSTLGTYCVRCLVWRPPRSDTHHCSTCQRCVTHFDHHCGVFGRCIVGGNMPCFSSLIGLLPIAFVTLMACMVMSDPGHPHHHSHHAPVRPH